MGAVYAARAAYGGTCFLPRMRYYADPARRVITASRELDDLSDLSDLSADALYNISVDDLYDISDT